VRCLSIVVTGDVLLHPPLVEQAHADSPTGQGFDFGPILAAEKPYVQAADLAICHLETPLAPPAGPFAGYPEFSVPPQVLPALVATGYDACSTASNHTLDQGSDGVNRTLDDLDAAGLAHDGSYRTEHDAATPTIITTAHGKVGFISVAYGFNDGPPEQPWQVNTLDTDAILAKAHAARVAGADLVIVAVHAGTEYDTEPNTDQVNAARTLLASPDIDLVYGHHAHVVQPLQKIDGKWVIYGLGNNIAAQETPVDGTHRGLLVRVTFSQDNTGAWSTSDIAWVPSLQDAAPPHRWCSLTAGTTCSSPAADAQALADTTHAVNLYGADTDGAHTLDHP
jgi:poly-gamma-glutamate synthesis protein (capsule biosynthesis protein)